MTARTGDGHGGPQDWGASQLSVAYGSHPALDHVDLSVRAGQVAVVVGEDGAGKTTLLRCLAGALRETEGQVRRPAPGRLGYLAPRSAVYLDLTVQENIDFRATAYHVPAEVARQRAGELLERTGLASARQRLAGQLSGGMRQKLGVIAAMLHDPVMLVLDEPTTGVDPVSRADLWWLIARAAAGGTAVVLSTSYLDEAERAAVVLALHAGRVLLAGTPAEVMATVPGTIRTVPSQPEGEDRRRAWRRAGAWRLWQPPGDAGHDRYPAGIPAVRPDLQDAVTVAILSQPNHERRDGEGGLWARNSRNASR